MAIHSKKKVRIASTSSQSTPALVCTLRARTTCATPRNSISRAWRHNRDRCRLASGVAACLVISLVYFFNDFFVVSNYAGSNELNALILIYQNKTTTKKAVTLCINSFSNALRQH